MRHSDSAYNDKTPVWLVLWHLVAFLIVSALAGCLIAGLAIPLVAPAGLGAKSASDAFDAVQADFVDPVLPQRNEIEADDGSLIAYTWDDDMDADRVVVPYSQISPQMSQALVSIEDMRFYQHSAIDLKGTLRALVNNSSGGANLQGGSSLAQQYVKNVLILEAGSNQEKIAEATADTISRKISELKDAIVVEEDLTKAQILERYLNLVYFGNGSYGVEAAAQRYFSVDASQLTATQSATLAAIVNSPTLYDPLQNPAAVLARRNIVLKDMSDPSLKYLTPAQAAADAATPLNLKPAAPLHDCITAPGSEAFFCTYVEDAFMADPAYGATVAARQQLWNTGGLVIRTTMDPVDEASSEKAVNKHTYSTDKVASALAMVQPGTGAIRAIAQSKPMGSAAGETYIDLAADVADGGGGGYQAGSSFKIFVGLSALEDGWSPSRTLSVPAAMNLSGTRIPACVQTGSGVSHVVIWPSSYDSRNDDGKAFSGNLAEAFWFSVNNYFLNLEANVTGLCQPAQLAQSMGVTFGNDTDTGAPLGQFPAFTLGVNLVTPIEMASAYATVAANGTYCVPYVLASVTSTAGVVYPAQTPQCRRVLDPNLAAELTSMLRGVLTEPGATATGLGLGDRPSAGKTGTTDSSVATWFDGFTPQLATAVWTGFINPGALKHTYLGNMSVGGTYYGGEIFGATISAPIWQQAMLGAEKGLPVEQFPSPHGFASTSGKPNN